MAGGSRGGLVAREIDPETAPSSREKLEARLMSGLHRLEVDITGVSVPAGSR
ncbi:hypothetical protein ACWCY1_27750 [Streptomyces goshikiensis]